MKTWLSDIIVNKRVIQRGIIMVLCICSIINVEIQNILVDAYADTSSNSTIYERDTSLTVEQLARIKEMAMDKTYIRDIDDFASVEAYQKYLEIKGRYDISETIDPSLLNQHNTMILASTGSATEKTATKAITLKNLSQPKTAIQAFYIAVSYVYTVQRVGSTIYLSRLTLSADKKTATYKDQMVLTRFGHCQTLEYFEWKGKPYFLMSCKDDEGQQKNENNTPYYWSLQIARVPYEAGKSYSYTHFKRLCDITKANKTGTALGTTKRCDGALSSDKKTLLVWCRNTNNKMQFTRYNMDKINQALDSSSNNYLSCGSQSVKNAWLATVTPASSSVFEKTESSSMQGLELNDANCTFIANGASNQNKFIIKLGSNGGTLGTIKIKNTALIKGTNTEIEGLQLKGDNVYFGICNHNKKNSGEQYIYSVAKSAF